MSKTKEQLLASAEEIRTNTAPNSNTADLVGSTLKDMINKSSDDKDELQNNIDELSEGSSEVISSVRSDLSSEVARAKAAENAAAAAVTAEETRAKAAESALNTSLTGVKSDMNTLSLVNDGVKYAGLIGIDDDTNKYAANAIPTDKRKVGLIVTYLDKNGNPQTYQFTGSNISQWLTITNWQGIDDEPTAGSDNLVKSGGVQEEFALGAVYDVSAKNPTAGSNNDGKWESLSALLSDTNLNILIPAAVRKGGMSIKFVQSSDNNYIQARLMANSFTTDVTQWQGVDVEPIMGSQNITNSNGVAKKLAYKKVLVISNLKEFATKVAYNVNVGESYRFVLTLGQAATGEVDFFTSVGNDVKQYYNTRDAGVTEIIWEVGITENAEYVGVVVADYATLGAQAKCEIYKLVSVNDLLDEEIGEPFCLKGKLDNIKMFFEKIPQTIQIGKRYKLTLQLPSSTTEEINLITSIGDDTQEYSQFMNSGLSFFEWEFFATKNATHVGVVIADSAVREGAVFCCYEIESVSEQLKQKINSQQKEILVSDKTGFYEPSTMMVNPLKAGQKYRIELSLGGATSNNVAFGTARSFIENAEVKQWSTGGSGTLVWDNFIPAVNVDYFTVYIQDYSTIGASSVLRIYQYFDNDMKENSYNLNYFNNISQIKNKIVLFLGHSLFGKDYNNPSTTPTGADEVCERMNGYNGNVFLNYAWGGSDWAENTVYPSVLARYKEATENSDSPLNASVIDSILICQGENGTTQLCIGYDAAVELAMSADPESVDPKNGHIVTTLKYIAEHSPQARIYLVKALACNIPGWTEEDHIQYRDALRGYCDVLGLIFIDGMLNTGIHKWIEADANTRFYTVDGTHPYTIAGKRRQMSSIMKTVFEDFNTDTLWDSFFLSKRR